MKGSRRRSVVTAVAAVVVLLGLWLWLVKAKPPQPLPVAHGPRTEPRTVRPPEEPAPTRTGSLSGVVRSASGKAVENARVCAVTVRSEVFWIPALSCASTNREGSYRIAPLGSTVYVVSAVADRFRPASALGGRDIFLGPGEEKAGVDIVLGSGGAQLNGYVLDATGGPISGATIRVLRRAVPHETTVTNSRPDGSFSVWTANGPITVLAEAREYASVRVAHVAPSRDLVLRLTPESIVSGRVVSEDTGTPVAGVRVRAIWPGTWNDPTQPSATSDSSGLFEIRGLEPGRYTLVGEGVGWRGESNHPLEVGLAKVVEGVTLVVSTAAVVTGRVVRRGSDEPCSRGRVTLGPEGGAASPRNATLARTPGVPVVVGQLEADGTVRFDAVPAGSYHVEVQCTDFVNAEGPTTLEVGRDPTNGLVWKVDRGARVLVRALDESGQPAANVNLFLREGPPQGGAPRVGAGPRPAPLQSFVTSAEGTYELTGLAPGLYTIEPSPERRGPPAAVDARMSDNVEVTVHLEGRGWIFVTVRTPEGTPVDQAEVRAAPAAEDAALASSGSNGKLAMARPSTAGPAAPPLNFLAAGIGDGRFQIGPLAPGAYRVTASDGINPPREASDWSQGTVRVGTGSVRAEVILRRGGSLTGRVVDRSGQPLPDLWVTADCTSMAGMTGRPGLVRSTLRPGAAGRTMTDTEGRFRIDRIASDARCTLRADQSADGGVGIARDVRPGDDALITMPELGSLSGTAMAPDGTPVTRFQVSVRSSEGMTRTETLTARDGHWSLSRVVPGRMVVLAYDPSLGDAQAQARVDLAPGERRDGVELQFRPPPLAPTIEHNERRP